MDRLAEIVEIEAIKQLKARYFRLMDEKRWDEWAEVFTEDFEGIVHGPHPELRFHGRDDGHYHEEYVKQGGRWRIQSMRLTRLRSDVTPGSRDVPTGGA